MSLTISGNNGAGIAPIEPGTYPAVCYEMVDLGEQYSEKFGNSSKQVLIGFEIPSETIEIDGKVSPRVVSKQYGATLGKKSKLRSDLISWRGKEFTDEEIKKFDLKSIIGAPCMLSIINKDSNGKTYANISGILALPKGMPKPKLSSPDAVVTFDLDTDPLEKINDLPQWIQDRIRRSPTYEQRLYAEGAAPVEFTEVTDDDLEDELPF